MGPFDYLQRRRERESAVPPGDDASRFGFADEEPARSEAFRDRGEGSDSAAQELTPGQRHDVAQLFQMVGAALKTGQLQIEETKTMDAPSDDTDGDSSPG